MRGSGGRTANNLRCSATFRRSGRAQGSSAASDPDDGGYALKLLSKGFDALYASGGRPSIPPERLSRALLLQVLYDYNFLLRWFMGLSIDDPAWDVTAFTRNRDRVLKGEVNGTVPLTSCSLLSAASRRVIAARSKKSVCWRFI
jgi:hypothetical protein